MATTLKYPHIEKRNGESARLERFPRIFVAQIAMDYLAHGWSADEMCRQHPYLTAAEAHAAMAFYFDHQEEVDTEIRSGLEEAEAAAGSAPRSPFFVRMRTEGRL